MARECLNVATTIAVTVTELHVTLRIVHAACAIVLIGFRWNDAFRPLFFKLLLL